MLGKSKWVKSVPPPHPRPLPSETGNKQAGGTGAGGGGGGTVGRLTVALRLGARVGPAALLSPCANISMLPAGMPGDPSLGVCNARLYLAWWELVFFTGFSTWAEATERGLDCTNCKP